MVFQFTLPRGERRLSGRGIGGRHRFNSRSHAGSDRHGGGYRLRAGVSIHAPTRGATSSTKRTVSMPCFNSRSHAGSDLCPAIPISRMPSFNSRSHAGSDTSGTSRGRGIHVSIHAPTRGATGRFAWEEDSEEVSIHAPTRGATSLYHTKMTTVSMFQFTLPRGERQLREMERADLLVSIHAPTRGATRKMGGA